MDPRLYQACVEGNTASLMELIREDPLVLERTITTTFFETPLHIVAMLGHVDFAKEVFSRSPKLAIELDSTGFYPLHVASTRDNVEMIRELLRVAPEVCLATDTEGRTPLHLAAMKGHVEIMKELFQCRPKAIDQVLWNRGETILHLCVNHNRLEALKLLLQWVIDGEGSSIGLNSKDEQGNTILHLAVAKKNIQIIKLLLLFSNNNGKEEELKRVEVNEFNGNGLTALDIVADSCVKDVKDMKIGEMIRDAGGLRAKELLLLLAGNNNNGSPSSSDNIINIRIKGNSSGSVITSNSRMEQQRNSWGIRNLKEHEKWLEKKLNTLTVVASLIASMAFQAMLNPPSSIITEEARGNLVDSPTTAIPPTTSSTTTYSACYLAEYKLLNTIGFAASMTVTILSVSGLPIKRPLFIWILMFVMWVATTSMGLSYAAMLSSMEGKYGNLLSRVAELNWCSWRALAAILLLMHITRGVLRVVKKKRINKRNFLIFWCPFAFVACICLSFLFCKLCLLQVVSLV